MKTAEEILRTKLEYIHFIKPDETFLKVIDAMEEYSSQFKSDGWISVKERLPERVPDVAYSQVQCLVNKKYSWSRGEKSGVYYQIQILVFNHEYECWDTEDGDDYDCDINQVTHWQPLPDAPKIDAPVEEGEK